VNEDFAEILAALSAAGAEFLVVGAHAMAAHGVVSATGALDLWIRATPENAQRVWQPLVTFGAPLHDLSLEHLTADNVVFQIGLLPRRIDVLTSLTGLEFEHSWRSRISVTIEGREVPVLDLDSLIRNKEATGRPRDLADVAELRRRAGS
jgi:hypothetical protein